MVAEGRGRQGKGKAAGIHTSTTSSSHLTVSSSITEQIQPPIKTKQQLGKYKTRELEGMVREGKGVYKRGQRHKSEWEGTKKKNKQKAVRQGQSTTG